MSALRASAISTLALAALAFGAVCPMADAGVTGPAVDETPVVGPGMNSYYYGADVDQWREIFESSGREVFDRRFEVIEALDLRPGMRIADVGAGTGLYTILFARAVGPTGRVYAVDISETFVEAIGQRASAERLQNIVPVVNQPRTTGLAPGSCDLVFVADTYHHFEYPRSMLASIHRALEPDGVLAIIDFRRVAGFSNPWILGHVRAGREQVIEEVESAGFRLQDEPLRLRGNYFLRFRKASS
ncbi:MAG: class I SAM-dependent methyltransferase [Thiohalocapsa sp.]|jgi:SAM-dependent methyltransferase